MSTRAIVPRNPSGRRQSNAPIFRTKRSTGASPRRARSQRRPARPRPRGPRAGLLDCCCGLVDPFCDQARSRLLPDGTVGVRVPYSLRQLYTLTTDANGCHCSMVYPAVSQFATFMNSAAGASFTAAAGGWSGNGATTTAATFASDYRIVSAGVRFRSSSAVAVTAGTVILTEVDRFPLSPLVISAGSLNGSRVFTQAIVPGLEAAWISSPCGPEARVWQPIITGVNTAPAFNGNTGLIVQVIGAPASLAAYTLEIVFNVELLVIQDNAMAQVAPAAPPIDSTALAASNAVRAEVGAFVSGASKMASDRLRQMILRRIAGSGARAVASLAIMDG
jgi:hypothetical protein